MANLNLKKQSSYNPFFITEGNVFYNELKNIIIFNNGGIIAQTNRGWFDSGNNYFKELQFDFDVKNKRKEDFTKKQSYIIKNTLYIHIDLLHNVSLQKHVKKYSTKTETVYRDIMTFEADGAKRVYDRTVKDFVCSKGTHNINIEYNFKFEKTDFGARIQMLADKAKEHGLKYTSYDFERLSEFFNIEVK